MPTFRVYLEKKKVRFINKLVEFDAAPGGVDSDMIKSLIEDLHTSVPPEEWEETEWKNSFSYADEVKRQEEPCPFCGSELILQPTTNTVECFEECGFQMVDKHYEQALSNKKK